MNMVRILLVLTWLILNSLQSPLAPNQWVPYTTESHIDMGNRTAFSRRIYLYLKEKRKIPDSKLKAEFNRWFILNLGHVFEDAALSSYGVFKNRMMYNGRIPDAVEDGVLEQFTQYTRYPASTFIEAKFMRNITLSDPRISGQLMDMIDFLSMQELHSTYYRNIGSYINREPGKAS